MSIIVTGGAGFIGYHLCKKLLDYKEQVICIDDLSSGQTANILALLKYDNFTFYNHNVIDHIKLSVDIKEIYHLACPASPKFYQKNDLTTLQTCFTGTKNMLDIALKKKSIILLTSTSEIYGEPQEHPQTEKYRGNVNCFGPRSCYDEGKRIAESLMYAYKKLGVDIRIARIFNTYGPNMRHDDGRVVSNFICQALKNKLLTIYGDGQQTRSFCYVKDTVYGLIKLMHSNYTFPLNIGNSNEITIKKLAYKIKKLANNNTEVVFKDLPPDDPTRRCPDLTKTQEILNWNPQVNLVSGLIHTIYYFQKHLRKNKI